jgi:RNA ligase
VCIPLIATRGSFHSEQAEWASQEIQEYFPGAFEPLNNKTYLFEIIYRENRIVVDYGDYEGLMLLDVIDNETGFSDTDEFDNCDWPDKVVRQHVPGFDSGQVVDIPAGGEGFVFLWPAKNFRTKMKSAEYVEIHRMISRLSEKTVWEAMVAGKTRDEIKIGLPEEFHKWIDDVAGEILNRAGQILGLVGAEFEELKDRGLTENRRDFALAIKNNPLRKYLFLMLDNKPVYPVALADSKPVKETNLTRED